MCVDKSKTKHPRSTLSTDNVSSYSTYTVRRVQSIWMGLTSSRGRPLTGNAVGGRLQPRGGWGRGGLGYNPRGGEGEGTETLVIAAVGRVGSTVLVGKTLVYRGLENRGGPAGPSAKGPGSTLHLLPKALV